MLWAGANLEKLPSMLRDRYSKAIYAWDRLKQRRGRRYEACRFDNYEATGSTQKEVVEKLSNYARSGETQFDQGRSVILFGPKGTGKDHLLMALAYEFIRWCGRSVAWINGVDLMEDFQLAALDKPTKHFGGYRESTPSKCDVLWISDPLPPSGALSDFQQRALFQLLDRRYNDLRPTWLSINVASGEEAEARMGAQVVDRLRQEALYHFCNWASFRTVKR